MRRIVLAFLVLQLTILPQQAPTFDVPSETVQGNTLRVIVRNGGNATTGAQAVFMDRKIRLYRQTDGSDLGLMPVPVMAVPGTYPLKVEASDGRLLHSSSVLVTDAKFPKQNIIVHKGGGELKPLPGEMEAVGALKETVSDARLWQEPFLTPTPDCMNSLFGVLRFHNGKPTGTYHKGVDLRSPRGQPIHATAAGVVQIARMFRLHGGTVGLDHGQGLTSIYLHMSKLAVKEGQRVNKGDVIGYVGATGFATGPHLHWQLFANGLPVNPEQWIPGVPRCR